MGLTGLFEDKKYKNIIKDILKISLDRNIPCGIHIVQPEIKLLKKMIKDGFRFIAYGTDGVFLYKYSEVPKIT